MTSLSSRSVSIKSTFSSPSQTQYNRYAPDLNYWGSIANALECTTNLRYLTIDVESTFDRSQTQILANCTFQLRSFQCDLDWDHRLVTFLNSQYGIEDLYVIDYKDDNDTTAAAAADEAVAPLTSVSLSGAALTATAHAHTQTTTKMPSDALVSSSSTSTVSSSTSHSSHSPSPSAHHHSSPGGIDVQVVPERHSTPPLPLPAINRHSLSKLSTLQCNFTEAANALVPNRPVTHLKTVFSSVDLRSKRKEMSLLFSNIAASARSLRSFDIGDATYTASFSLELLEAVTKTPAMARQLRHLATLVLPVGGPEVCARPSIDIVRVLCSVSRSYCQGCALRLGICHLSFFF